jgi:hypothetical protein
MVSSPVFVGGAEQGNNRQEYRASLRRSTRSGPPSSPKVAGRLRFAPRRQQRKSPANAGLFHSCRQFSAGSIRWQLPQHDFLVTPLAACQPDHLAVPVNVVRLGPELGAVIVGRRLAAALGRTDSGKSANEQQSSQKNRNGRISTHG